LRSLINVLNSFCEESALFADGTLSNISGDPLGPFVVNEAAFTHHHMPAVVVDHARFFKVAKFTRLFLIVLIEFVFCLVLFL
jgi:hypothetical protein